ncbi:hypothetical protein ASPZODRAFT_134222 [Penicilliopsis zonata CBS 506.65]|uniref:Asteroid domain-containing protein n=1 Tax=Penicilliopsis zonata CBS 506.65 TaxID=1073090 RepID=A0A1L9SEI4_9EURO|nr:hypothetical protein ASPZODRAFT_134222 [Penicilliopsis zonata CBS 506.65]OJJ45538.1 hypothetical protein ASPZODRAFT_134222 [Penicilliopsis zonata CBS 506.65]
MEKSRYKLEIYYAGTKDSLEKIDDSNNVLMNDPLRVLKIRNLPTPFKALPENSFMVASVFEDLKGRWNKEAIAQLVHHELGPLCDGIEGPIWSDITVMVAGEADGGCAAASHLLDCAVLTNDSDLLLYDLGRHGSVIFLDSVEMKKQNTQVPTAAEIRAMSLCPSLLSSRLGISDIKRFAYELKKNPRESLAVLLQRSKHPASIVNANPAYRHFLKEYQLDAEKQDIMLLEQEQPQTLDNRVSEIFWQFKAFDGSSEHMPRMYLPIINEDPSRKCAWEDGRSYRTIGYSLLNASRQANARFSSVDEYTRKGARIVPSRIALLDEHQVELELIAFSMRVDTIKRVHLGNTTSVQFWRSFALAEIYGQAINKAKNPRPAQLKQFIREGYLEEELDWPSVHLSARVQAIFYSLRILKQLLGVIKIDQTVMNVAASTLAGLPPLHLLMMSRREMAQRYTSCSTDYEDFFHQILDSSSESEDPQQTQIFNQLQGNAEKAIEHRLGDGTGSRSSNIYDILMEY